jgi:ABC-type nitrate/sulfonate/bicarbonate transport system substrate-binding protein
MGSIKERHRSATIGFLAALGVAVGYGDVAAAQAPYVMRYGVDTERNINALSQVIADRQGFLAHEGIKLEPVRFLAEPIARATGPPWRRPAGAST